MATIANWKVFIMLRGMGEVKSVLQKLLMFRIGWMELSPLLFDPSCWHLLF